MRRMQLSAICYLAFVIGLPQVAFCFGDRIVFPDEAASLLNKLNISDSNLNRRPPSTNDGTCATETGKTGQCLPLEQCPELLRFLKSRNGIHTPGTADFMRKRICKYVFKNVHLCCIGKTTPVSPITVKPKEKYTERPVGSILPSDDECGVTTVQKIIRGQKFQHGVHPWLVGIGYSRANGSFQVECGGTLITKKHVLTAAHCFLKRRNAPQFTHVILGEHSLSKSNEQVRPIVLRIEETKNPGYNRTINYNDISLLILEREVSFTSYIRPACLPFESKVKYFDLSKIKMIVAGWGRTKYSNREGTDEPLEAEVSLVPKPKCRKAYSFAPEVPLDDTQICLGGDGKDACKGDSGGPLIYKDLTKFHRYFVIGVVAFGRDCGNPKYPGVYSYVPKYMPWILSNL